jgi:AcrR family transcriptional regulator
MTTKDRILDAALTLFNRQGTGAVSTNHIAEAAHISPGNLYYHYRNKEAIIRALFERLFALWDVTLTLPEDRYPTLDDLRGLIRANFAIMADYSFVYREIVALLRQDEALRERYLAVRQRGYQGFREAIGALVKAGVLIAPPDDTTVERLADLCWLISEFWLSELEVSGADIHESQMERGIDLMMQVLHPYIQS